MLDRLLLRPEKATLDLPQKATTGAGAAVMSWGMPVTNSTRDQHQIMKDALAVFARGNRWVRRAEMVISGRVGGAEWHLEDENGDAITDQSSPEMQAYRDLFEKPLGAEEYSRAYPNQPATRRNMWGITSRHMGLCNVGFWHLDEIDAAAAFPKRLFLIRPDRMSPRTSNGALAGWTLDGDAHGGGTDLSLEEVLPFYLDQPDSGFFGTGLVESILSTLGLPSAIDRHAIDTLSSGGRLPGIYSPKEAGTNDDVFERMVNDLRVIKDMPDSSKRDLVARAPLDFTPTSSDMSRLNVEWLSRMSRDDVLTHWGVPLATIGGAAPTGLNSGSGRSYDEAALWQNSVQFRVDALYETIQYRLLDRLKAIGINLQIVIDVPEFDDDTPRYDLAVKANSLPLRNIERRAILGLDPFGDPALDNAVWMPVNIVTLATAPEVMMTGKASLTPVKGLRVQVDRLLPRLQADLRTFLDEQRRTVSAKVRAKADHLTSQPKDETVWWNAKEWDQKLQKVLAPYASQIADLTAERTSLSLKGTGKAEFTDLAGNKVLQRLLARLGGRITGINETTRQQVADAIREGVEAGDGAAQLGDRIEALSGFDEYRAELVGRTESALVLNESQIESFREFGVERVIAIDGDGDEECAARDGQEFDLDEAMDIADHPNGTLDWSPVVGGAA